MRYIVTMYMRYIEYIQSSFDKVGCRESTALGNAHRIDVLLQDPALF